MNQLLKMVESMMHTRIAIIDELHKLMLQLYLTADFSEFSCFYDFVFFMCRENGQKNITVSRAVAACRLVLVGRFRLLNRWFTFVEHLKMDDESLGRYICSVTAVLVQAEVYVALIIHFD
ncbi:DCN1-like protein [Hibiscus syriacus]|uniref:DCN1-like protein n=1 Tax=Hibiscus syriacus TaxID=106335 RepID=UPI0019233786|nr:DCN1-like protein [Hibiscus syriacus]